MSSQNLLDATKARDDEFYTPLAVVEGEFAHYEGRFAGKRVLCNADDPSRSAFYRYFRDRFAELGLAKLTATGLGVQASNFGRPVGATFDGDRERPLDLPSGSFASPACLGVAREHDVVVSNPPFSMIRGYTRVLASLGVEFSFIAPLHAISLRDIFRLMRKGEMFLGATSSTPTFERPAAEPRSVPIVWLTNMAHSAEPPRLDLTAKYDPEKHPRFVNDPEAINVDRTADIPGDFAGPIGVPLSAVLKMPRSQFEIVGFARPPAVRLPDGSEKVVFFRLFVRNRDLASNGLQGSLL